MSLTRFTLLEVLRALQERQQFVLTQVRLADSGSGYEITVPEGTWLATTPTGRKELERSQDGYRWAAGGGLVVLDCTDRSVALVRHRDKSAPSYGDHWTLGSGLSSSVDEFMDPLRLAVREAVEEFVILTPQGILMPAFEDSGLTEAAFGAAGSSRVLRQPFERFATNRYVEAAASLPSVDGEKRLSVAFEGVEESRSYSGLVVVDKNTNGIDLLKPVRIKVPCALDELSLLDGEASREGKSLNAPVGCLPIEGTVLGREFAAVYQSGIRMDESEYRLDHATPVLKAFMNVMS
jgi:hypothetical protein